MVSSIEKIHILQMPISIGNIQFYANKQYNIPSKQNKPV